MIPLAIAEEKLATDLELAIERQALTLVFQPKIEIASGRMTGVEALARWDHPSLGAIGPSTFVSLAERFGSIDALTEWVIDAALRQWTGWRDQGLVTNLAFNISALTLRDVHFPDHLDRMCRLHGVPCDRITLEVTEGATQHAIRLLDTLTRFRIKGIGLSLDDFGTGYSSLLQLRQLPYTELKIDQCFVKDAVISHESRLIIRAMVDLAHGLGLTATAEGVENEETLALLGDLDCDHGQGFFICHPLRGTDLVPWLMERGNERGEAPAARAA
jgi:EAL domain-containing protein (putative c-di-GMP-specific phosphodiesterase class I)